MEKANRSLENKGLQPLVHPGLEKRNPVHALKNWIINQVGMT